MVPERACGELSVAREYRPNSGMTDADAPAAADAMSLAGTRSCRRHTAVPGRAPARLAALGLAFALGFPFVLGPAPARAADPAQDGGQQSGGQASAPGKGDRGEDNSGHVRRTVTLTLDVAGNDEAVVSAVQGASSLYRLSEDGTTSPDAVLRATLSERRRLLGVLFQQARYAAIVEVTVAGVSSENAAVRDAIEAAFARGNVPATIAIRPGPVFHVGQVAVRLPDGRPSTVVGVAETGLKAGAVAGQGSIVDAEASLLAAMRRAGYPLAGVGGREVIADHATDLVDVTYTVDPGRQANFGAVEVRGTEKMRPDLIRQWAPFKAGERYNPAALEEYARYLRSLGVFDSVRVVTADAVDTDGAIPVIVTVSERKRRYIGASASFATTDGAVLTAYWGHRNLFGGGERIRIEATTSRLGVNAINDLEYSLGYTFVKPGLWSRDNELSVAQHLVRQAPDAYTREGFDNEITLNHRIDAQRSVSIGFAPSWANITDSFGKHYYALFGLPMAANIDTTDDKLNPSQGYRAVLQLQPVVGDIGDTNAMLLSGATLTGYHAFDEAARFIIAGKVQVGSVIGPSLADTPANDRLYAGGGGSIRGYAYQAASPRNEWGQLVGGRSLFVTSLELRTRITENIGVVPFVDAGSAYTESWPDFSEPLKVGVGLGLRYFTPIGPLRLDVATPLTKEPHDGAVAAYLSIGQAF